jgi:hypothetical protein
VLEVGGSFTRVNEQALSGGFNVPHDYFKPMLILPATPPAPPRRPWLRQSLHAP